MISDQPISSHLEGDQGWVIVQLQRKLKQAAKRISQLAKEKQQLIEVGNRLRAALNKNGENYPNLIRTEETDFIILCFRNPSPFSSHKTH